MENTIKELLAAGMSPDDIFQTAARIQNEQEENHKKKIEEAKDRIFEAYANYLALVGVPDEEIKKIQWDQISAAFDKMIELFLPFFNSGQTEIHNPFTVLISDNGSSGRKNVFEELFDTILEIGEDV